METDQGHAEWQQWHEERLDQLREPHGWLSLTNLEWLSNTRTRLESFPGCWAAEGHTVTVTLTDKDGVTRDGDQVTGTLTFEIPRGEADMSLADPEGRVAEIASRFGRIAVRTRDPKAATRVNFKTVPTFAYDPQWIRTGPWKPYAEPAEAVVPSAYPGGEVTLPIAGETELFGQRLLVAGKDPEHLNIIFHDETNGIETEAWRAVHVAITGDTLTADFNRAVSFPAHFTPFGTCPTPPAGNTIPAPIYAGEKKTE